MTAVFKTLVLVFYCHSSDNVKTTGFQNFFFKETNNITVEKTIRVTINFPEK